MFRLRLIGRYDASPPVWQRTGYESKPIERGLLMDMAMRRSSRRSPTERFKSIDQT